MISKNKIFKLICLSFIVFNIFSCSSNDDNASIDNTTGLYRGNFISGAHPTSGFAYINNEKTQLNFTSFKSDNGPDLNIYLVSNLSNVNSSYIDLGDIKGINGNYTYDLPTNTDFSVYRYVVVWCVDFDVNFGYATLTP